MRTKPAQQLPLKLPQVRGKEPTNRERRTLLSRLPAHADNLTHRGIKRAIREALRLRWVAWQGSTLHSTDSGREVLARLNAGTTGQRARA